MKSSKSRNRTPRQPARSEIGQISYEETRFKVELKDRNGNPARDRSGNVLTREAKGSQYFLRAIGPQGRYRALVSKPFEGSISSSYESSTSEPAIAALSEFVRELWNDGWQPTSTGRYWYQINFRRIVPEPEPEADDTAAPRKSSHKQTASSAASHDGHATTSAAPAAATTTSTPTPNPLAEMEAKYKQLRAEYAAGRLNPDQYRAAMEAVRAQDAHGRYWTIDPRSGKWLTWDGKAWVPAPSPLDAQPS